MTTTTNAIITGRRITQLDPLSQAEINLTEQFPIARDGNNHRVSLTTLRQVVKPTLIELNLDKVDNTPDRQKPISIATAQALLLKAHVEHGHAIDSIIGLENRLTTIEQSIEDLEKPTVQFVESQW